MLAYSQFQQQYPLSQKKFWKKIFGDVVGCVVILIVAIVVIMLLITTGEPASDSQTATIVFWLGGFVIVILGVYLALKAWYVKAYIKRYYYDCNADFVTIKKGVFAPTEIHVQYQKIQDVYVDQDILDRIMGLYDVHIASATVTSGIEAHIDGVEQQAAEGIKNFLLDKIKSGGTPQVSRQASSQSSNPQASSQGNTPALFSGKVSSAEYPIQGRWLMSAAISNLFAALFIIVLLFGFSARIDISFGAIIYLVVYLVIIIFRIFWLVLWKNSYHFEFMPEYILLRDGVIGKEERHFPYKAIQNVTLKQGIIDRLFGLGSVSIENAANQGYSSKKSGLALGKGIVIPGQPIDKAGELLATLNLIMSKVSNPAGMGL